MKKTRFVVALGLACSLQVEAQIPRIDDGQSIVAGQVRDLVANVPLQGVRVTLESVLRPLPVQEFITDSGGSFEFEAPEAGPYGITAELEGYIQQAYEVFQTLPRPPFRASLGAASDTRSPAGVDVEDGRRYEIHIEMVRSGTIVGRVYDSERQPVFGAQVEMLVTDFYDEITGHRDFLEPIGIPVLTDEAGEYVFSGVVPGDYFLRASIEAPPFERVDAFGRVQEVSMTDPMSAAFFPGVQQSDYASMVAVRAGTDVYADIHMPLVPSAVISGRVINPLAFGDARASYAFYLVPGSARVMEVPRELPDYNEAVDEFELRQVPPGSYDLYVVYRPSTGDGRRWRPNVGRARIEVGREDIAGVAMVIGANVAIEGQLVVDETARAVASDLPRVRPMLTPAETLPPAVSLNPDLQILRIVGTDGRFVIENAVPARYRVSVLRRSLPPGVYLASARMGVRDVLGLPFDVNIQSPGPLVLELRGDGGRIEGEVVGRDERPLANATVVLIPPFLQRDDPDSYRVAATDSTGRFSIEGIRPAEYTIVGFDTVRESAWLNEEFRTRSLVRGTPASVQPSSTLELRLRVE